MEQQTIKKRGRPAGYRKQADGTWVRVITTEPEQSQTHEPEPVHPEHASTPKKRGRPAGYRKMPDGTWVKQAPEMMYTKTNVSVNKRGKKSKLKNSDADLLIESDSAISPTAADLKSSKDHSSNVFSFVNIVVDISLKDKGISDEGFIHNDSVFKLFAQKYNSETPIEFYLDDPYNSLTEEEYSNFYDWLEIEGYFKRNNVSITSSTNGSSAKRLFTLVLKGGVPFFILCPVVCHQDGSYNVKIGGIVQNQIANSKATSLSGIWGIFPSKHLKTLSSESKALISDLRFTPVGFYASTPSFNNDQFEVFFDGLVVELGSKAHAKTLVSLEIDDMVPANVESTAVPNTVSTLLAESHELEESDDQEKVSDEEYTDDYDLDDYKLKISHKKVNDFVLEEDGVYRRRFKDRASNYVPANHNDIYYDDTNIERDNYQEIGEGHYRSVNHQLSDDIDFDSWD